MVNTESNKTGYESPVSQADNAVLYFKNRLASGANWYIALLETIRLWTDESEIINGREYNYLIGGEAFDWLLLTERLCDSAADLIPETEKFDLLFRNKPPIKLTQEEFKELIGPVKYNRYLNYFYGVVVEESLVQAVREEVRKERQSNCRPSRDGEDEEVFDHIYGVSLKDLLKDFRKSTKTHPLANSSLTEMKNFFYWCFKYRVENCEKAKVASDTNKALEWLRRNGYPGHNNP